jgi:hypothetical protein
MATQIQLRRGTAATWVTANPVLAQGELGLETDTNLFKFGDGASVWTALEYFAATISIVTFQQVANTSGAQALTLPLAAASGWSVLCINGLRQSSTQYSVAATSLTLPAALNVMSDDLISLDYIPT